jgi:hypothetical protein
MSFPTKKLWIETVNSIQTKLVMRGWPKKMGENQIGAKVVHPSANFRH